MGKAAGTKGVQKSKRQDPDLRGEGYRGLLTSNRAHARIVLAGLPC